jgi:hypothetical protein
MSRATSCSQQETNYSPLTTKRQLVTGVNERRTIPVPVYTASSTHVYTTIEA